MSRKIFLCIAMIFFVAVSGGCAGTKVVTGAVKGAGKAVSKTTKKIPGVVKDQAADMAIDYAMSGGGKSDGARPAGGKPSVSRAAKSGMVMAGGAAVASELLADDRHWIQDRESGAYLWNPEPQDGETISWSGGVVNDGGTLYADGPGTVTWYKNGRVIQRDEGSFDHGRHHGRFSHTFPSGNVEYSNWDHGTEVFVGSGNDNVSEARQAYYSYHRAITNGNYREAYNLLSSKQKQRVGNFDSYVEGFSNTISSEVTDLTLVSSDADSCTFDYTVVARDHARGGVKVQTFRGEVTMAKDGGRWFVRYARSNKINERYE